MGDNHRSLIKKVRKDGHSSWTINCSPDVPTNAQLYGTLPCHVINDDKTKEIDFYFIDEVDWHGAPSPRNNRTFNRFYPKNENEVRLSNDKCTHSVTPTLNFDERFD